MTKLLGYNIPKKVQYENISYALAEQELLPDINYVVPVIHFFG
jgi:hypothetical protein